MGQPVRVVDSRMLDDVVLRVEVDRSLTGSGHERYVAGTTVDGVRPTDELARRLFATEGVESLHAFSNLLTVTLRPSASVAQGEIETIINELFIHYRPGVTPTAVTP